MSLTLVPTPIGHKDDFTLRGLAALREAEVLIVEEYKESSQWLRAHGITGKEMHLLNEHSTANDCAELLKLCESKNVALITDCGTPGFADPGADLVKLCRHHKVPVRALPGASSLMTLLSLSSERLSEFVFRGFLPAENEERNRAWKQIATEKRAVVLMDTPYRLQKMLSELGQFFPDRKILLTLNLTQEDEVVIEDFGTKLSAKVEIKKAEFMILVYPKT